MKILLHACCADCLLKMVESIKNENNLAEISVYYYNPNIHPRSEYVSRLKAVQLMAGNLQIIVADWVPKEWFGKIKDREKGERCTDCWQLRLEKTAILAKDRGFNGFSSTLLASEYQNTKIIEKIGKEIEDKYGIKFLIPENIYKKLKTKGFYKQVFCGCCYSLLERFREKFD